MKTYGKAAVIAAAALSVLAGSAAGAAEKTIKVGNTMPYSGPLSAYGTIGKTYDVYFKMVNAQGGVDGHQVEWISYDDAYSPPKTVEQTRRLIESDEVDMIVAPLGTATTLAVRKYVNAKKIPEIFIASGSSHWDEVKEFPYTMGLQPAYSTEATIYAKDVLATMPGKKMGVLYQNDDFGRDYIAGLKVGFGDKYDELVVAAPYDATDPTVDSQILNLKAAGVDVVFIGASAKFAAQAVKKIYDLGWDVPRYLSNTATSLGSVLKPAGLAASKGLVSAGYIKDVTDTIWDGDADVKEYRAFMAKWAPEADAGNSFNAYAYMSASTLHHILEACDGDYSSANFMKNAEALQKHPAPLLLPGVALNTSATDHLPIEAMQLMRFDGEKWVLFGSVIDAEAG